MADGRALPVSERDVTNGGDIATAAIESATPGPLRVLLVEDCEDDAELVLRELRRRGLLSSWQRVDSAEAMRQALRNDQFDVIISDYQMPQFGAFEALEIARRSGLDLPFLIVSGTIGEEVAIRAMKLGAHDYLMKGNLARLVAAVEREVREAAMRRERRAAEAARRQEAAVSAALARAGRELIAGLDTPVVLDRLCQVTAELLDCTATCTLLRDDASGLYQIVASYGGSLEEREALRVVQLSPEAMDPLLSRLAAGGVLQLNGHELSSLAAAAPLLRAGVDRALFVGLFRGRELFGLLEAGVRAHPAPFAAWQERIAEGLGQLASLALENVRLFEAAQEASRLKSDFVATISHELRTPLHIIIGYNTLLLDGVYGPPNPEQADALSRIDRSARQLVELIEATLDLSRLEAGRVQLDLETIDVGNLMAEVEAFTREARRKEGVDLIWETAPDLPPLVSDAVKLKVVIQNLIDNAIKFTDAGRVIIGIRNNAGALEITVSDTGIGIAPELIPVIFEPFRQGDSSPTRRYEGVGLGLYIVRRMLDLLGGKISVHSVPGQGSSFHVWLPFQGRS